MFGITASKFKRANTAADGLALRGYDPVAYVTDGRAVEGRPELEYLWDDARYRFASAANRERFAADPGRYLPAYGGYCSWGISQKKFFDGDPTVWRMIDGKLYLNYNRDIEKTWLEDVSGFIEKADRHWPEMRGVAEPEAH